VKEQLEFLIDQFIQHEISFAQAEREFKRRFIEKVLEKNRGNQSKAAGVLGIHRNTLSRNIEDLELGGPKPRKHASR